MAGVLLVFGCSVRQVDKWHAAMPHPILDTRKLTPDVKVGKRIEGKGRRYVLLGFIKWGDSTYAENAGADGLGEATKARNAAAYQALSSADADVLVGPQFAVVERNYWVFKHYTATVSGYAGKYNHLRQVKEYNTDQADTLGLGPRDLPTVAASTPAQGVPLSPMTASRSTPPTTPRPANTPIVSSPPSSRPVPQEIAHHPVVAEATPRTATTPATENPTAAPMERPAPMTAETEAKARALLQQESTRLATQPPTAPATPARPASVSPATPTRPVPAVPATPRADAPVVAEKPAPMSSETEAQARALLQQESLKVLPQPTLATAPSQRPAPFLPAPQTSLPPGLPPNLTSSQVQRLAELYRAYKEDRISHRAYQRARTKIINE
jgi:hypothetical protein